MWRTFAVAAVCSAVAFAAGVLVAPRLHHPPAVAVAAPAAAPFAVPPAGTADRVLAAQRPTPAAPRVPRFETTEVTAPEAATFVGVNDVPAPIRDLILRLTAERAVKRLSIEPRDKDGRPHFKLSYEQDGAKHELFLDPAGTVKASETQMAMNEIPSRVTEAIAQALPGAGVLKAKKLEGAWYPVPLYEVDVRGGGDRREVQVNDSGEIVRIKVK
jgi:hypothetical protein